MSHGTATASRSATNLTSYGIRQSFKRSRTDTLDNNTPFLTVTPPGRTESTDTVTNDTHDDSNIRFTARKLDRLFDKEARFQSHKEFLTRCLTGNVIPNGLRIELEPSIGNHDEDFLTKWNDKLIKFSKELTTDVIEFCDKTITETTNVIEETKTKLKDITDQEQESEISQTLLLNQDTRKTNLKRNKDKKYYNLKYRNTRKPTRSQDNSPSDWPSDNNNNNSFQDTHVNIQPGQQYRKTYSGVVTKKRSNTNAFTRPPNNRNNSSTNLYTNKMNHLDHKSDSNENSRLRKRVQDLENQVKQQYPPRHIDNNNGQSDNASKNTNSAQSNIPGAPLPIHDMLEYITNTMQTLNGFKTQLTQLQDTGQTLSGMF